MSEIPKQLSPAPFVAWANHGLPPPDGYDSFLAYAVACMDTRALELENLFGEASNCPSSAEFLKAVEAEYRALRQKAGVA